MPGHSGDDILHNSRSIGVNYVVGDERLGFWALHTGARPG